MQETGNSRRGPIIAIVIAVLAIAGLVTFALSNQPSNTETSSNPQPNTTNQSATSEEAAPAPSERMAITFTNNGFSPNSITVTKGTIVTVKNESSTNVQFSSDDHPTHRKNPEMNLKDLAPGESDSYTATAVGTWGFHNHLDPSQTGTVTVKE